MDLAAEWPRCRDWLLPAIQRTRGTHLEQDVVDGLIDGSFQLWPGANSALITEVLFFPRMKVLNFFLAGGELSELIKMEQKICDWAKSQGCRRISLGGRKGWKKALPNYEEYITQLFKDI